MSCHDEKERENGCCREEENNILTLIIGFVLGAALFAADIFFDIDKRLIIVLWAAVYLASSFEVVKEAFEKIFHGEFFNEEVLMTVATVGALAIGQYPEAVAVMLFYRLGELFEDRAVDKSMDEIKNLMDLKAETACVIREGLEVKVSPEDVAEGEITVVRPGEKIPLDGIITEGKTGVNTSALTGESKISYKSEGDTVISGSLNTSGVIKVRVTKVYSEGTVSKIMKLVENASQRKAKTENFITKFAKYYTPAVVGAAFLIALIPSLITGDVKTWIYRALSFLVVSCPCALAVSVPLTFFAGIGCASKHGILIKGSEFAEALAKADTVIFDKTGTLTKGNFTVEAVHSSGITPEELLETAASAERYSNHPAAESITEAYGGENPLKAENIEEIPGMGITAEINGEKYFVGNGSLMERAGAEYEECELTGTIVHVSKSSEYLGHIVINDEIKPDAVEAIAELKKLGTVKIGMLTGDDRKTAERVAKITGVDFFEAELLPEDKIRVAEKNMSEGGKLIFAGDGINDAPVLMRADVGIAMGALGSDAAIEAADVVIMDDKPSKVSEAIKISVRTLKIAKQNIILALCVKAAILVLSAFGITNMWIAVFGDVGVLILAVLNSLRAMKKGKKE